MAGFFDLAAIAGFTVASAVAVYALVVSRGRSVLLSTACFLAAMSIMAFVSVTHAFEQFSHSALADPSEDYAQVLFLPLVVYTMFGLYAQAQKAGAAREKRVVETLDRRLADSLEELGKDRVGLLQALSAAVDARDHYTALHSLHVADYAAAVGYRLGMHDDLPLFERAGLLHDIGKIGVPDTLLLKRAGLTAGEYEVMKRHADTSARIIETVSFLSQVVPTVRHHHEHWDGAGYPDRLVGQEIPRAARVLAVADAFDAMTTDRPYRPALGVSEARSTLLRGRGTQWDPDAVDAMIELVDSGIISVDDDPRGTGQSLVGSSAGKGMPMSIVSRRTLMSVVLVLGVCLTVGAPVSNVAATPGSAEDQQVLILVGPQYGLAIPEVLTSALVDALHAGGYSLNDIYVEFLDLQRNPRPEYRANVLAVLGDKLSHADVGLIIAVNQAAVDFVAREGKDLLPGVPLLIPILEQLPEWEGEPRDVIALSSRQDATGTLRHALDLFPATERVVLISGIDDRQAPFLGPIEEALGEVPNDLQVERTSDLTYEEMLEYLSGLPPRTIAFYGSYFEDVTGRSFVPAEVAAEIGVRSAVPVFAFRDQHIMQGLVGGSVAIVSDLGEQAARTGIDYLQGELELVEPVTVIEVRNVPLFDWRQVERFGGNVRRLPGDTVFINRPHSLWENHRETVLTAAFSFALLAAVVAVLLVWSRRLKAMVLDRDRAQGELWHHKEHLEQLVTERTRELELANAELEEAARAKSRFLANTSHELRTPLNSIIGFSGVILQGLSGKLSEEQRVQIAMINRSGRQLLELINNLLDLTKVEAGRIEVAVGTFDPGSVVREVAEAVRPLAEEKDLVLRVEAEAGGDTFRSDESKVRQILLNLLGNAVKFTETGTVTISLARGAGRAAIFAVEDTGPGIREADFDRVFEAFVQVDLHNRGKPRGTGLGLALSREYAHLLGGEITVAAELGVGSTFTLTVPDLE